jgi:hypothetical protein
VRKTKRMGVSVLPPASPDSVGKRPVQTGSRPCRWTAIFWRLGRGGMLSVSRTTQWILTVSCLLFGQDAPTIAAEPATKTSAPLASLPSKPGSHVERIKAMGDNAWLYLGAPTADPRWGKALGRAYSPRMVYLPKQEAAFLAGQGPHGGMKPGGIYQDEIFAYNINAHRWI